MTSNAPQAPSDGRFLLLPQRFTTVVLRATLFVAVFGLSLALACARIAEAPWNAVAWLRIGATLVAIATVACARRSNFVQRALLAFAIEFVSGVATLVYVDMPYVDRHAVQISCGVAASYHRLTKRDIVADLHELRGTR